MGQILIKLGNFGPIDCFDVIMTSFLFFKKLFLREATLLKGIQLCAKGNNYAAPDCDTCDSDICV